MTRKYVLSPLASDDLRSIWSYIAQRNPSAADKVIDEFYEVFTPLAGQPGMWQAAPFGKDLKRFPCGRYVVYFLRCEDPSVRIEIARVVHGSRDTGAIPFGGPDK